MTASDPGEPIAIIGMSALFAGADSLSTLWRNIVEGVDSITDAPPARIPDEFFSDQKPDRPASDRPSPDRLGTRRGGFVDDLAWFDPAAFGVMPVAVAEAEPDQLLALRLASEAVEDAGGMAALGRAERTAVILGRGGYLNAGVVRLEQRTRISHQVLSVLRQLANITPSRALGWCPTWQRPAWRIGSTSADRRTRWTRRAPPRWWRWNKQWACCGPGR
jgi:acyl transferase domain-containing protein